MHVVFDLQELRDFLNTTAGKKKKKVSELPEHQTSLRGFFYSGINTPHIPVHNTAKLDRISHLEDRSTSSIPLIIVPVQNQGSWEIPATSFCHCPTATHTGDWEKPPGDAYTGGQTSPHGKWKGTHQTKELFLFPSCIPLRQQSPEHLVLVGSLCIYC